jgi:branched-chain amino acid aminotransferase/4-amino-4-deoxychorismate lyase
MFIFYNTLLQESKPLQDLLLNRSFLYGDGLFETMIYSQGKVKFLADHYQRLVAGMTAMGMIIPAELTVPFITSAVDELIKRNRFEKKVRIKLHVWRKPGGVYTPTTNGIEFYITTNQHIAASLVKEKVLFYEEVRLHFSKISSYKTCSALPYVLAGVARNETQADDMILLDVYGHVAECIASNLFWLNAGKLYTPSLQTGCVAGVMRKQVLKKAAALQIPTIEGLFTTSDLLQAEAVFCCNAAGIQSIAQIEEKQFSASMQHLQWFQDLAE